MTENSRFSTAMHSGPFSEGQGGKIISALGPDRDLQFLRACLTFAPCSFLVHFDDDDDDGDDDDDNYDNDDDELDDKDQFGHNSDNF